jgi:hypothetical protein
MLWTSRWSCWTSRWLPHGASSAVCQPEVGGSELYGGVLAPERHVDVALAGEALAWGGRLAVDVHADLGEHEHREAAEPDDPGERVRGAARPPRAGEARLGRCRLGRCGLGRCRRGRCRLRRRRGGARGIVALGALRFLGHGPGTLPRRGPRRRSTRLQHAVHLLVRAAPRRRARGDARARIRACAAPAVPRDADLRLHGGAGGRRQPLRTAAPAAAGPRPGGGARRVRGRGPGRTAHRLEARTPLRLRAIDRSRVFRFVDDVEARVDPDAPPARRSAARVGRGDLGVNRRRIERWFAQLADQWGVAWPGGR